ncbi:glycoside hydrolase [Canicola haemoglobinophilus]|uniref:Lysozyme n=1 Tax=Canicola haemoglobinophilus TaxID=733 RepID=A0A1V4B181_9PAST|nr:lysozyme [Canicola haemoglobinophilus]OOS00655.1 glycoside hydrolase [Canicola haemoglobinophilus]STO54355.1 glycoside hydrolase family protein [Canicola haemoglobinophilus]STO60176.1 glycoside hydrolase family protein [Canicola haemoglobinophilus]STO68889.1 glycoside hydrolase family protein [Canicola haemoglobinophilus]
MNKLTKWSAGAICSVATIIALVKTTHQDLRISQQGLEIIGQAEGCRRDPYHCPADVLTVGIGSTAASGEPINPQKRYNDTEIAQRWAHDLRRAEQCVNQYGNGKNLPQGAFDALVSLTFNVGCGKMQKSTLFKQAQQGFKPQMCQQFDRWVYAGGQKLNGLIKRRAKEKVLCLGL